MVYQNRQALGADPGLVTSVSQADQGHFRFGPAAIQAFFGHLCFTHLIKTSIYGYRDWRLCRQMTQDYNNVRATMLVQVSIGDEQ